RDLLRSRAAWVHRQQGHAESAATRAMCARVRRRARVPFAAAGGAARDLWRTSTDRALAGLSRDVPAALAHRAGAQDVAPASKSPMRTTLFRGDDYAAAYDQSKCFGRDHQHWSAGDSIPP